MQSLPKKSTLTFIVQSITFIFGIVTSVILARVLGPTNKGIYTLMILIPTVMSRLGTLGIESASVYYTGSSKYPVKDMVSNAIFSGLTLGGILVILFSILMKADIFQKFVYSNQINPFYLWFVVLVIPFDLVSNFLKNVILGKERILDYNKVTVFQSIFQLIAVAIFLLLLQRGVFGATFSYILTVIGSTLFIFIVLRKITRFKFSFRMDILKDSIAYGWKAYIGTFAQFLNYRLNMFLLALFLPPAAVGYYSISVLLVERLWMVPTSIGTVLFPRISSLDNDRANSLTPRVSRHTFFIVVVLCGFLVVLARPLILFLFGTAFLASVVPFLILLPGVVAIAVAKVFTSDLAGRGRPEFGMFSALGSLAINIPLNIILIPKWGISGAAFSTSCAYMLAAVIAAIPFKRICNKTWSEILLIKTYDFKDYLRLLKRE